MVLNVMLAATKGKTSGYWADRAVAQVRYADRLSKVNAGAYDGLVNSACQLIMDRLERDGALTRDTAEAVEAILIGLSALAKGYKVVCAAHAHIDMNWMWGWDETVSITLETFRTMLDLMREYPDYTFSQSQASVYRIVEDHDPGMLDEIGARVKEGRWEVTASTWVETDKNIPSGESLARHILYSKRYLSRLLDIDPDSLCIDFEPDTFGHSLHVPEILNSGNVKFYYHCRGYEGHTMYRWVSPSGSSVVVYREPVWYNAQIDSSMALYAPEYCQSSGLDTMLKVYGVGDHGGGPTRRDIERIIDMNSWPIFPEIRFGTFAEFFGLLEGISAALPVVEGELNFVFDGCYTTQTRIKKGNRKSEVALNEAEAFSSISSVSGGGAYPAREYAAAWENVLFNHFHDIIPGSGVIDTREYAMGLYQKTLAMAGSKKTQAFRELSRRIDTTALVPNPGSLKDTVSEGAGVGFGIGDFKLSQTSRGAGLSRIFHFFNSSMHAREETLEVVLWDWSGDTSKLVVKDEAGEPLQHSVVNAGHNDYWGHSFVNLLVRAKVPACGYATCVVDEDNSKAQGLHFPGDPRVQKAPQYCLENSKVKVTFCSKTAAVLSFVDKATGEDLVDASRGGGSFRYIEEDSSKGMTAWVVGRYMSVENLDKDVKINWVNGSPDSIMSALSYQVLHKGSKLDVTVKLAKDSSFLDFDVRVDWREVGLPGKMVPQLGFYMPLAHQCSSFRYDVPFGSVVRAGLDMDVPANSWALGARTDLGKKAVMLMTDSKYGFRCQDSAMSITLVRSSTDPDPYPEFGVHKFGFAVGAVEASLANGELIGLAYDYNHPVSVLSGSVHDGQEAATNSLFGAEGNIAVSAVKAPESGATDALVVRVYETEGQASTGSLRLPREPKRACFVDLNEREGCGAGSKPTSVIGIDGGTITFAIGPSAVATILVEF